MDAKKIKAAAKAGERAELWDTACEGLHVIVTKAGAATFAVRYRFEGRQRRLRLGRFGVLTPEEARKAARKALAAVASGEDPQGDRQRAREGLSIDAAFERFIEEPGKRGPRKPRTTELYRQLYRDHIAKRVGRVRVDGLQRREVERLKLAVMKATSATVANRALSLLKALLYAAERWGERDPGTPNPCSGVTPYRENARERFLKPEERAAMVRVLDEAEGAVPGEPRYLAPGAVLCVRLLSLTGARLSEITTLRWSMVDLEAGCLRLRDSKTGRKVMPLSSHAVELLRSRADGVRGDELVCPSNSGTPLRNMGRVWSRIRERAGLAGVRLHDLRHSFASDALNAGVSLAHVGAALGHHDTRTTARYAHVADTALRRAIDSAGAAIEASTREGSNVVRLCESLQGRQIGS